MHVLLMMQERQLALQTLLEMELLQPLQQQLQVFVEETLQEQQQKMQEVLQQLQHHQQQKQQLQEHRQQAQQGLQQLQQQEQQQLQPGNGNHSFLHTVHKHNGLCDVSDRVQGYGQNLMFSKTVHYIKPVPCQLVLKLYCTVSHTFSHA